MFETGIRQFRMAMAMALGRPLDPDNLARLVGDALATVLEFGEPGSGARELTDGPFADPETRDDFADRALRRTARRLAVQSPFYARRFAAAGLDPRRLDRAALTELPVTTKQDLIERQAEFRCADATPYLATRTTGTTGRAAEIWMSDRELRLWAGLGALTGVLRGEIGPADLIQVHVSSRATASVHLTSAICRLVGAGCRVLGVVPPGEALDALRDGPTLMSTSASYLGELTTAARRRGLGPSDFRLRRIDTGGEVLSGALRAAAEQTFGARANDAFGMTEVIPVTASTCSRNHLHHDLSTGHVEVLDLETAAPAAPGALGTVVISPYHPYRECMPVFRYDTRDVVRVLPDEPLDCELAGLPGVGPILGKADQLLRLPGRVVSPREVVEAVESLPAAPWPSRFAARAADQRLLLTLPRSYAAGLGLAGLTRRLAEHGLVADVDLVDDDLAPTLRRLRSDLHETTFVAVPARVGG